MVPCPADRFNNNTQITKTYDITNNYLCPEIVNFTL